MDWRRIQVFAQICGNKSFTAAAQTIDKLFPWLERCEKKIGFKNLSGYDTKRLYAYLGITTSRDCLLLEMENQTI